MILIAFKCGDFFLNTIPSYSFFHSAVGSRPEIPMVAAGHLAWPQLPRVDHWWRRLDRFGKPGGDPVREIVSSFLLAAAPASDLAQ